MMFKALHCTSYILDEKEHCSIPEYKVVVKGEISRKRTCYIRQCGGLLINPLHHCYLVPLDEEIARKL